MNMTVLGTFEEEEEEEEEEEGKKKKIDREKENFT